jgi:hypothetical protein
MKPSIYITVRYDKELQDITGVAEDPMVVSAGALFPYVLMNIFLDHPAIDKNYKPGELGFLINGIPPTTSTILRDGDIVNLSAHKGG